MPARWPHRKIPEIRRSISTANRGATIPITRPPIPNRRLVPISTFSWTRGLQSSDPDGDSAAVTEGRRRRATLRRLSSLTRELQKRGLTDEELTGLLDAVQPQSHLPSAWLPRSLVCPPDGR